MFVMKGKEGVSLWMAIGERMVHGDKPRNPSYDSMVKNMVE